MASAKLTGGSNSTVSAPSAIETMLRRGGRRYPDGHNIRSNVFRNHRTGSDYSIIANRNTLQNDGVCSNPHVATNRDRKADKRLKAMRAAPAMILVADHAARRNQGVTADCHALGGDDHRSAPDKRIQADLQTPVGSQLAIRLNHRSVAYGQLSAVQDRNIDATTNANTFAAPKARIEQAKAGNAKLAGEGADAFVDGSEGPHSRDLAQMEAA